MSMYLEFCRSGPPCSRLDSTSVYLPSGKMPSTSLYSSEIFAVDRDLPGVEVNAKYVGVRRAVADIDQFRIIVAEVLRFERAFRRFGADDFLLVLHRGRAVLVDDVGGVDDRLAFSQLIGILSARVGPCDLHLL